jgi:hypothetical protein
MNKFQNAVAKVYGGGDYAYMAKLPKAEAPERYNNCGDTLFAFLMRELADDGEPMSAGLARARIESAMRDVNEAYNAVKNF